MSLLIVNRVDTDIRQPYMVSAEITLGGRPEQVVLDLSWPGLIAFERMPGALDRVRSARQAVIDLMMLRYHGDVAALPADLSSVVRQANEPWPLRTPAVAEHSALAAAAAAMAFEISRVELGQPEPGFVTVHLDVCGTPTVVIIDHRGGPQRATRFRFVEGLHPWQLAPAEQYALAVAIGTVGPCQEERAVRR